MRRVVDNGKFKMRRLKFGFLYSMQVCSLNVTVCLFACVYVQTLKGEFKIHRSNHFIQKCIFYLQALLANESVKVGCISIDSSDPR